MLIEFLRTLPSRLLDIVHADSKLYLVFEFLDVDLKRYIEHGNKSGTPMTLDLVKVSLLVYYFATASGLSTATLPIAFDDTRIGTHTRPCATLNDYLRPLRPRHVILCSLAGYESQTARTAVHSTVHDAAWGYWGEWRSRLISNISGGAAPLPLLRALRFPLSIL